MGEREQQDKRGHMDTNTYFILVGFYFFSLCFLFCLFVCNAVLLVSAFEHAEAACFLCLLAFYLYLFLFCFLGRAQGREIHRESSMGGVFSIYIYYYT